MAEGDTTGSAERRHEDRSLPAGSFSSWVVDMQTAIRGRGGSDVPCDGCTACCTSSQFVHIGPDETDVLAHIPAELLFPAPGRPRGHRLMGYDERGHCPMLVDDRCSIYEHRPVTCRTYDCRIFPAAGIELEADDPDKAAIAARARRWRFDHPSPTDRVEHEAVLAAAAYLRDHPEVLPDPAMAASATMVSVLAIELHPSFLARAADGTLAVAAPDRDEVQVELRRRTRAG